MYKQSSTGRTLPETNLQFIQNKPTKMRNGRQLRRMMYGGKKTNKALIIRDNNGFGGES